MMEMTQQLFQRVLFIKILMKTYNVISSESTGGTRLTNDRHADMYSTLTLIGINNYLIHINNTKVKEGIMIINLKHKLVTYCMR